MLKIQSGLDNYIGQSKNIDMEQYKTERIIALQVEFNELLNELPFLFKYWSNKGMNRKAALEEYVDGLHFILSIGNDLGIENYHYTEPSVHDMRKLVLGLNNMISRLNGGSYKELVDHFILFGEKLGFSLEEIESAYMEKNRTNYRRQEAGY
ncbi:dUTP diphosphatase [Lentibacillus sp. N15]